MTKPSRKSPWQALSALTVVLALAAATAASAGDPSVYEVIAGPDGERVYKSHAIAMHGEPKHGPDFTHFDYVDPEAPKGGTLRLSARGTFDTFNGFNAKGTAGAGSSAIYETLLATGNDEAFTKYGLLAESLEWPEDRSWVVFTLRPEARWHDGRPVTVEDVIFSLETIKTKGTPFLRYYFQSAAKAEKVGERRVKFTFSESGNRELPLIVGGDLPIMPKHYWEGRDFGATTLEPPLGSGPYRIGAFEAGRFVELQRVEDYWGRDLPVRRGQDNFDRLRYDYFRDPTVIREALKSGSIDFFSENSAKDWATAYDVQAVASNLLIKERFLNKSSGGMQTFTMNSRRPPFDNRLVRQALAYAYDFQWTNNNIYYGQYEHPASFFAPMELASSGLPKGEELEILERYRGRVPKEVFTTVYQPPETDGSGWPRDNLRRAFALLAEAGWVVRDFKLVNAETGQPMSFEFLYQQQNLERSILPFKRNLERLGIDVRLRLVDTSQYINRLRKFDFDMIIGGIGQALSPGNEQRGYWSSAAADSPASRNFAGIKDPVVDELVELVIAAPDRESLIQRTRALDRVLLWGHYVIPQLVAPHDRIIYWDKFGRPEKVPLHGTGPTYWWWDEEKADSLPQRLKTARQSAAR